MKRVGKIPEDVISVSADVKGLALSGYSAQGKFRST